MTEHELEWASRTRREYFGDLLLDRYPAAREPEHILGALAVLHGPETVLSIANALEGRATPDPTIEHLSVYAYAKFFMGLVKASRVQ